MVNQNSEGFLIDTILPIFINNAFLERNSLFENSTRKVMQPNATDTFSYNFESMFLKNFTNYDGSNFPKTVL